MQSRKPEDKLAVELIKEAISTGTTELNLWGFGLTEVPVELGELKKLLSLDLSNNLLTSLPKEIGLLTNLVDLNLAENRLSSLPLDIGNLTKLSILNLDYNQLSQLPDSFFNLTSLTSLSLRQNRLKNLSEKIGKLTNLISLDLSGNRLLSLPTGIGQLINLSFLKLWDNVIRTLPTEIQNLTKLPSLDLHDNNLIEIPKELGELNGLSFLNLAENSLRTLPESIGKLVNLISLNVSGNKIYIFPLGIGKLNKLIALDISNNKLRTLPQEINLLTQLEELDLNNNELDIPQEISDKITEPQKILNYLAHLVAGKRKSFDETKILIIGQGSVGKTSIVQRLLYDRYNIEEIKTEGIEIYKHKFTARNRDLSINIWDFGGQEILHATHQFFLTKRSLYLLVLDARLTQEENRVEYWLKIIQSFGADSPVIIAGNKTDQHPLDIDRTGLQKKYTNIVDIIETSAKTGKGIETLKRQIAMQVSNLPHVKELLPETWLAVKTELEKRGKNNNFITQDEYFKLCDDNKVIDQTSKQTLLGFLHDLGVILHFQEDPRLEALGILNPHWVTNGVYKILNSLELFQNHGTLTISILNRILDLPDYPSTKRLFIVDMMKKFELCYDIVPDSTFLVPDLLPKDEPFTGDWNNALAFQIHYNILPSSIISRFIVRMNDLIYKTVWRSGVILKNEGNLALIKADVEERKIYIWVRGEESTRRDFLAAIRMQFNAIHKTISRIEANEKVPIPEFSKADPVDYKLLLQLEKQGVPNHHVQAGDQLINLRVRALLSGIEPEIPDIEKNIHLRVEGNIIDSTITIGDDNIIYTAKNLLKPIYRFVENSDREDSEKDILINNLREIETTIAQNSYNDENALTEYFHTLRNNAPDIAEKLFDVLANPNALISSKTKKQLKITQVAT